MEVVPREGVEGREARTPHGVRHQGFVAQVEGFGVSGGPGRVEDESDFLLLKPWVAMPLKHHECGVFGYFPEGRPLDHGPACYQFESEDLSHG